ncbi:MAG: UvrD-helicase domain-containing protein [Planctomycetes bacterium]|nr:UvrD-helicase domain-containing protein [Planctomycetota bacterium]
MSVHDLNPSQQEAVNHIEGPLLVLAGPGSGKTRVITRRIVRLIEAGVAPGQILAITFTNKAAGEMATRVSQLLPGRQIWVSTFHRLCARLLRRDAAAVGLAPNFTIIDTTDQASLIRNILSDLDIDSQHYKPGAILHRISRAKFHLQSPDDFLTASQDHYGNRLDQLVAKVYPVYQQQLLKANAVDFDDLLMHVCRLLSENEEIRAELDHRFRYVMVDEYQDTNLPQYQIVRALSHDYPNLCATGDPDQSIYGWRGAEIGNILRFEQDFPDAHVIRLEQNYRSTPEILRLADTLISHNTKRKQKSLFTDNASGAPVECQCFDTHSVEAHAVAAQISQLAQDEQRPWSDFAVFYRVNSISRELERALTRLRIPYQVAAGVAFYERAEVKDLLCYLRLIHNPADRSAFLRVVNSPVRGIGKTTLSKLSAWADHSNLTLLEACRRAAEFPGLKARAITALRRFGDLIHEFSNACYGSVSNLLAAVLDRTRYGAEFRNSSLETDVQRAANIDELRTAARQYDEAHADDPTLQGFLEETALVADTDAIDATAGQVTLMTLHAAKGLEFPVVHIVAVEEGLLPHDRATRDGSLNEMEEERRLLFVGITRAEQRLFLTRASIRTLHGKDIPSPPSRFLAEMNLGGGDFDVVAPAFRADPFADHVRQVPVEPSKPHFPTNLGIAGLTRAGLLTTGADLLNRSDQAGVGDKTFVVGGQVRHPQFGLGKVVEAEGQGKWRTVKVIFGTGEPISFVVHKCPLQPVGIG